MVSFTPATHKLITATNRKLDEAAPVDGRVALARLLQVAGFADIQFGESAPGDNTKLWYKGSTNVLSRYNPIAGAWSALTEGQFSLWLQKRAQGAADNVTALAAADTFLLQRAATGEAAKINAENLKAALGLGIGQIVGYWVGYYTLGTNEQGQTTYTANEVLAKNIAISKATGTTLSVYLKPTVTIPKCYVHFAVNIGTGYLGDWAANVEKSFTFNGGVANPGVMLFGTLS